MKVFTLFIMVFFIIAAGYSISDDVDLSDIRTWGIHSISGLKIPTVDGKPLKQEIVNLGKQLFFDPRLSRSNQTSCSTCHNPEKGLSDGRSKFVGDRNTQGERRSPAIQNLAWAPALFWDGRAGSLEEQALMPIAAEGEMNQDMPSLITELKAAGYQPLFQAAFGPNAQIEQSTIARAIADFERSLISYNSAFDRYMTGDHSAMSKSQLAGMMIFVGKANCAACHNGPNFTDFGFHDLGMTDADEGRYKILPLNAMKHAFKTPGLRDVASRGPFMHDGSLSTLEEVIDYYDRGGEYTDRRNDPLIHKLNLTETEKTNLIDFLNALSGSGAIDIKAPKLPGN
ncbi:MAG: tryptophan tryptophylquinone biosynthesis enzyme MauG [Calditrichaeota bacterium]|nr:tryptophan tryptophylquinone biosynthesis enzyme MauG [Calditrichota bacterium]